MKSSFSNYYKNGALAICLLAVSPVAIGHGYIENSRAHYCQQQKNTGCGPVQYEPQSVEGPDRFPGSGPADGTISSAGIGRFSQLNEQTPNRWHKLPISAGQHQFKWVMTAPHVTRDYRYFITRSDWNSSAPLSRASFENEPFCAYSGDWQRPPSRLAHNCEVPGGRSGYHIILGVWDVGDTAASFYQVVDVDFSGGPIDDTGWVDVGDIQPAFDLQYGDRVFTRVFDRNGQISDPAFSTSLKITDAADGDRLVWTYLLSKQINIGQDDIKAGVMASDGAVNPVSGKNDIFAKKGSGIVRVEIDYEERQAQLPLLTLSGLNRKYSFVKGDPVDIGFTVASEYGYGLLLEIYDDTDQVVSVVSGNSQASQSYAITIDTPVPGAHSLVAKLIEGGTVIKQVAQAFELVAAPPLTETEYDYVYPESKSNYAAGDLVLGAEGKIYRCKQFPYAAWCQGAGSHYAPGTGLAWPDAWDLVGQTEGVDPQPGPDYNYPQGLGSYLDGSLVEGEDGNMYRCRIAGWCNGWSLYYAPGSGVSWSSAWQLIE